jgi:cell division septum initiation protein DivIVA
MSSSTDSTTAAKPPRPTRAEVESLTAQIADLQDQLAAETDRANVADVALQQAERHLQEQREHHAAELARLEDDAEAALGSVRLDLAGLVLRSGVTLEHIGVARILAEQVPPRTPRTRS